MYFVSIILLGDFFIGSNSAVRRVYRLFYPNSVTRAVQRKFRANEMNLFFISSPSNVVWNALSEFLPFQSVGLVAYCVLAYVFISSRNKQRSRDRVIQSQKGEITSVRDNKFRLKWDWNLLFVSSLFRMLSALFAGIILWEIT